MTETLITAPRLETPRLVLRPLTLDDVDDVVRGLGNYDVVRWLSQVPYPYRRQDAVDFIEGRVPYDGLIWGIEHQGRIVGGVSVDEELGYWLARPEWGKGLGFEAVHAVVAHWFSDPNRAHLSAGYFADNSRSELVLRCLGFRPCGSEQKPSLALHQTITSQKMHITREFWLQRQAFSVATKRLRFRPLHRTDASDLMSLTTPAVARMVSSIPPVFTDASAKAFIVKRRWQGVPGFLMAIETENRNMIGCIGCGGSPITAMIFLGEEHWGQGYAKEASAAFVNEIFDRFPISKLYAEHFLDNPASGRILEGMQFEAVGEREGTSEARLGTAPIMRFVMTRERFGIVGPL